MKFSRLLLAFIGSLIKIDYGLADEPKGILYENEDKSGKSVNYFEETDDYGHIQSVVDSREMSGIALLCATGVFILYNHEEFDSDSNDEIRILAGKDTCLQPGSMRSLLFAQSVENTTMDSLAVFSNERFGGGMPLKINRLTENDDASLIQIGQVNSFILMGNSEWTITTRYRTFCIKPGQSSDYPICPIPSSKNLFLPEELNWLSARLGCAEDTDSTTAISLDYCFNHGSGNLEPVSSANGATETPEGENSTTISSVTVADLQRADIDSSGLFETCDNLDEFTMLLKFRLTHDFDSLYQVQFPLNKAHSWRTEILDYTMEIVDVCIADGLVDKKILRYVREMYIYLAEKLVWTDGKGWPLKPRQRVFLVGHETGRCYTRMLEKKWVNVAIKLSEDILNSLETPEIKDKDIDQEFLPIKGYDLVMEFIWLSINYVGAACHAALEYETDFWMDYMNVAHDMYLRPMAEFWGKPEAVLSYYPVILGGFGVMRQHRGLAAATSALYEAVSVDKLPRPIEVEASAKGETS